MAKITKQTKTVRLEDLVHPDYNPRDIKRPDLDTLKRSIERFGLRGLITINVHKGREGMIVGGNMTVMALREMEMEVLPEKNVDFVDLPEKEEKALSLALNKVAERRSWNDDKLAELMWELNRADFDMKLTGFDDVEISHLLDMRVLEPEDDEEETLEEQKEAITKPESKLGEVYVLGRHRLMCGDSTNPEHVAKLMNKAQADMVFTDPPYNVDYTSHETKKKFPTDKGRILGDAQTDEEFKTFSQKVFQNCNTILKPGASIYVCSGYTSYPLWYYEMQNAGLEFSSTIVWVKPSFSISWGDYKKQYEQMLKAKKKKIKEKGVPIMYGWKAGERHSFFGDNNESDIWELPRKAVTKMAHPTEKPEWLIMRAIKNSSKIGQTVVDLFGGSGSTLFAANKTERVAYLMELDPRWCDVIRNRWKKVKPKA